MAAHSNFWASPALFGIRNCVLMAGCVFTACTTFLAGASMLSCSDPPILYTPFALIHKRYTVVRVTSPEGEGRPCTNNAEVYSWALINTFTLRPYSLVPHSTLLHSVSHAGAPSKYNLSFEGELRCHSLALRLSGYTHVLGSVHRIKMTAFHRHSAS